MDRDHDAQSQIKTSQKIAFKAIFGQCKSGHHPKNQDQNNDTTVTIIEF
jgi:hypothetical protein